MESYILEWLNLLGRWLHVVTGIAWIGASFYFIWLDNHLQPVESTADTERGVGGEIWSVHGGGFYHAQKYKVAPPTLPTTLHWFKWEAYSTWLSGMFMLALMYWYQAEIYSIDPAVMAFAKPLAVLLGVLTIVIGWFGYDLLCKSKLGNKDSALAAVLFVLLCILAFALCHVFSGRAAYMHFGAMLGTIMVGNVFFVIMPGQRDLVAAKQQGREPDPIHGIRAKQRSVHNTYFTLPVLFVMFSNHYAMTYAHEYNWLILIVLSLAGALIRVYFVQRHFGRPSIWPPLAALVLIVGLVAALAPRDSGSNVALPKAADGTAQQISDQQAHGIVVARCGGCHSANPSYPGFTAAPKGMVFDTPAQLQSNAQAIYQQTVVTRAMPIGNLTHMTDDERAMIASWFRSQ